MVSRARLDEPPAQSQMTIVRNRRRGRLWVSFTISWYHLCAVQLKKILIGRQSKGYVGLLLTARGDEAYDEPSSPREELSMASQFEVIDADGHITESDAQLKKYMPEKYVKRVSIADAGR